MLTQKEMIKNIFRVEDIKSPVARIVQAVKKQYNVKIQSNLVSTVRQQILRGAINNVPVVVQETTKLSDIVQLGTWVKQLGGLNRVKQLISEAENIGVNW